MATSPDSSEIAPAEMDVDPDPFAVLKEGIKEDLVAQEVFSEDQANCALLCLGQKRCLYLGRSKVVLIFFTLRTGGTGAFNMVP